MVKYKFGNIVFHWGAAVTHLKRDGKYINELIKNQKIPGSLPSPDNH
jgi:hypothetical protein